MSHFGATISDKFSSTRFRAVLILPPCLLEVFVSITTSAELCSGQGHHGGELSRILQLQSHNRNGISVEGEGQQYGASSTIVATSAAQMVQARIYLTAVTHTWSHEPRIVTLIRDKRVFPQQFPWESYIFPDQKVSTIEPEQSTFVFSGIVIIWPITTR